MPLLDEEFRQHLQQLMRETAESLHEQLLSHTNDLVQAARNTNNSAAIPIAYGKASIENFRARTKATIDRYFEAFETCSIVVDAVTEREMIQEIHKLTGCHPFLSFPPMIASAPNAAAVQNEHAREAERVGRALGRESANRLRELKMKTHRSVSGPVTTMTQEQPFTISTIAPTFAELKARPMEAQAMLLLRRLVQIYPSVPSDSQGKSAEFLCN